MRDFAGGDLGIQYIAVLLPDQGAASDCATTLVTGATSVQWTPVSRNSSSASPCSVAGTALVITKCPKPLRSGVVTGRPSYSRQENRSVPGWAPLLSNSQRTCTLPVSTAKAPCFAALVASSCSASPICSAAAGVSTTCGPAAAEQIGLALHE